MHVRGVLQVLGEAEILRQHGDILSERKGLEGDRWWNFGIQEAKWGETTEGASAKGKLRQTVERRLKFEIIDI